jgi:hypothetical protein
MCSGSVNKEHEYQQKQVQQKQVHTVNSKLLHNANEYSKFDLSCLEM